MSVSKNVLSWSTLMARCVDACSVASIAIRDIVVQQTDLQVTDKSKNDPQTLADLTSQRLIAHTLREAFPDLTVVGEEDEFLDGTTDSSVEVDLTPYLEQLTPCDVSADLFADDQLALEDVTVWVDPLDGTREFTKGDLMAVTVLVGIAVQGQAEGGVIAQPFYTAEGRAGSTDANDTVHSPRCASLEQIKDDSVEIGRQVWACKQAGSVLFSRSGENGPFSEDKMGARESAHTRIVTSRSHYNQEVKDAFAKVNTEEVLRVGGAGNKVLFLLNDRADIWYYPTGGTSKWDICAPAGILSAFGGGLLGMQGEPYGFAPDVKHKNDDGVVAYMPGVEDAVDGLVARV